MNLKSKLILSIIFSCFLGLESYGQNWTIEKVRVVEQFEEIEEIFHFQNDTTYLINFWATWCGPCVREMPYIEALNEKYDGKKFKTILVSLDFEKQIESRLLPYLNKNKIKSEVILLLDGKANNWIDKVDSSWSGAIPISLIYNKEERLFHEKEFHSVEELENIINHLIN